MKFTFSRKMAALFGVAVIASGLWYAAKLQASDHDDGEREVKGRNLNLTDLYVFREDWQTGNAADDTNMIFVMNLNPRSLPRQQYFFSTVARYEFHVSRLNATDDTATASNDLTLRFTFGAPDANGIQAITVTRVDSSGNSTSTSTIAGGSTDIKTTTLANAGSPTNNAITLDGQDLTVFAGLREDPFFFDVEQFFKVRGGAAASFNTAANAKDFAHNYNVLSIVVRVPIAFLQSSAAETAFDVWETVSVPQFVVANN